MRIARATEEEVLKLNEFLIHLEEMIENSEVSGWVKDNFPKDSWRRVIWGYMILHDNAADTELDYLDFRQEIKAALA